MAPPETSPSIPSPAVPNAELSAVLHPTYTEFHGLPCLPGEADLQLWVAKRAAAHDPAVVCDLATSAGRSAEQLYSTASGLTVEHYGIPEVIEARSPEAGTPFVAWAVQPGQSLRSLFEEREFPNQQRTLEITRALAEILAELHRFGKVVCNLAPATTWLAPGGIVQILGLGLGTHDVSRSSGPGLRYRAPEQLRAEPASMSERLLAGDLRERADLWALGMIALELCDHQPRFTAQTPPELLSEFERRRVHRTRTGIAWEFDELLSMLLEPDVEQRLLTAEEVAERLDDLLLSGYSRSVARSSRDTAVSTSQVANKAEDSSDWNWRSTARDLQQWRRTFDEQPERSLWLVWLLPTLILLVLFFGIWWFTQ